MTTDKKIEAGDFVMVSVIDELPDGDGEPFFKGWDEVQLVQNDGIIQLYNSGLLAKEEEVLVVARLKKSTT